MKNKKITGICAIFLLVLSLAAVSQQPDLPVYLSEEDGWEYRQVNGENYYLSPDAEVIIHIGDGRGTVMLIEEMNGEFVPVPKDLVLNPGRDSLRYTDGKIDVVDIQGGENTDYKVVSTIIDLDERETYSDTTYILRTEAAPNPADYAGKAKTSVNLEDVYPDSQFSPTAVKIGSDIVETRRQAYTEEQGLLEQPVVIPDRMESWEVKDFIESTYGLEIPQDVEINNAYLKDVAKQIGRDPDNFVFDTEMADAVATIYIPEENSAAADVTRIANNREVAEWVLESPIYSNTGELTSEDFTGIGILEGNIYERTTEDGEVITVFQTEDGTTFLETEDGMWAATHNVGESTGRNFNAEPAETGFAIRFDEGIETAAVPAGASCSWSAG